MSTIINTPNGSNLKFPNGIKTDHSYSSKKFSAKSTTSDREEGYQIRFKQPDNPLANWLFGANQVRDRVVKVTKLEKPNNPLYKWLFPSQKKRTEINPSPCTII